MGELRTILAAVFTFLALLFLGLGIILSSGFLVLIGPMIFSAICCYPLEKDTDPEILAPVFESYCNKAGMYEVRGIETKNVLETTSDRTLAICISSVFNQNHELRLQELEAVLAKLEKQERTYIEETQKILKKSCGKYIIDYGSYYSSLISPLKDQIQREKQALPDQKPLSFLP